MVEKIVYGLCALILAGTFAWAGSSIDQNNKSVARMQVQIIYMDDNIKKLSKQIDDLNKKNFASNY